MRRRVNLSESDSAMVSARVRILELVRWRQQQRARIEDDFAS